MSGNIKGITIEFRGDTTQLDKALRQVNSETKKIDKELNAVNKALKFNPKNVDLLRQKQTLLTEKIGETEDKLKLLKLMVIMQFNLLLSIREKNLATNLKWVI